MCNGLTAVSRQRQESRARREEPGPCAKDRLHAPGPGPAPRPEPAACWTTPRPIPFHPEVLRRSGRLQGREQRPGPAPCRRTSVRAIARDFGAGLRTAGNLQVELNVRGSPVVTERRGGPARLSCAHDAVGGAAASGRACGCWARAPGRCHPQPAWLGPAVNAQRPISVWSRSESRRMPCCGQTGAPRLRHRPRHRQCHAPARR